MWPSFDHGGRIYTQWFWRRWLAIADQPSPSNFRCDLELICVFLMAELTLMLTTLNDTHDASPDPNRPARQCTYQSSSRQMVIHKDTRKYSLATPVFLFTKVNEKVGPWPLMQNINNNKYYFRVVEYIHWFFWPFRNCRNIWQANSHCHTSSIWIRPFTKCHINQT